MSSERMTENLVRDLLRKNKYYASENGIIVEEQKSEIKKIKGFLSKASKSGTGKSGYPEFIITSLLDASFVIVVECKADVSKHQSPNLDNAKDYAVDGVLHYARCLSKDYTVIAVAVSGVTESSLKVSSYLVPCGSQDHKVLVNESKSRVDTIIPFDDYYRLSAFDPDVERKRHQDLVAFAKGLHEFIWTTAKIPEEDKPLLVSGTLISLMYPPFLKTFEAYSASEMPKKWLEAIKEVLDNADIPKAKKDTMLQPYANVASLPNLGKPDSKLAKKYPQGVLNEVIKEINENVWPFISVYHNFDVVGHFYGEFLKYAGGDKKALGIVLTPRHITELMCELSGLSKKDTVLDICAGTGGFLISAMQAMLKTAITDEERQDIKKNKLIGIENNPKMFALASSNMILRGDGKANLHQGSCFDDAILKFIKDRNKKDNWVVVGEKLKRPTIGLLNPPYAQSKSDAELHELYFVKHMLDQLEEGGIGVAIIPISCVISSSQPKREIIEYHRLKAVMSMPQELFYPVGTVTCIVVFEAHKPHGQLVVDGDNQVYKPNKKSWFGYWRDDGFVKTKHMGRIDKDEKWKVIRKRWIESFENNEVHAGESVTAYVGPDDEWCAEAYMETDYSKITKDEFEDVVRNYAIYRLIGGVLNKDDQDDSAE